MPNLKIVQFQVEILPPEVQSNVVNLSLPPIVFNLSLLPFTGPVQQAQMAVQRRRKPSAGPRARHGQTTPWSLVHEFTTTAGDSAAPPVGEFSCTERINLGYEGATGIITRVFAERHAHVFRFGTVWTVRLAQTGEVVWSGRLKEPHRMGDQVLLTGEGLGKLAEKTFARLLFQDRDVSHWSTVSGSESLTVEIKSENIGFHMGPVGAVKMHSGEVIGLASGGTPSHVHVLSQEGGGGVQYWAPGTTLTRLAFAFLGGPLDYQLSVLSGNVKDEDGLDDFDPVLNDAFFYSTQLTLPGDNPPETFPFVVDLDLTQATFGQANGPVNFLRIRVTPIGVQNVGEFSATISEIRVGGIVGRQTWIDSDPIGTTSDPPGSMFNGDSNDFGFITDNWPDYYPLEAMVGEIASRIGVTYRPHNDPALLLDSLPADFVGQSAADVLNYIVTLAGGEYHWRMGGTADHPRLFVGKGRRVTVIDREQPVDLVALDRYDRVHVPWLEPDGTTMAFVTATADRPYQLHPHRDYGALALSEPFRQPHKARDFGTRVANALRERRWGGTGSVADIRDHRHQRRSALLLRAGWHVHDPISGHTGQVESLTKSDTGVADISFVGDYPVVDSVLARRDLKLARR